MSSSSDMSESEFNAIMNKQVEQIRASIPVRHMSGAVTDKDGNIIQFTTPGIPRMGLQSMANRLAKIKRDNIQVRQMSGFESQDDSTAPGPSPGPSPGLSSFAPRSPIRFAAQTGDFISPPQGMKLNKQQNAALLALAHSKFDYKTQFKGPYAGQTATTKSGKTVDAARVMYTRAVQQERKRLKNLYVNRDPEVTKFVNETYPAEKANKYNNSSQWHQCINHPDQVKYRKDYANAAAMYARRHANTINCGQYKPNKGKTKYEQALDLLNQGGFFE